MTQDSHNTSMQVSLKTACQSKTDNYKIHKSIFFEKIKFAENTLKKKIAHKDDSGSIKSHYSKSSSRKTNFLQPEIPKVSP